MTSNELLDVIDELLDDARYQWAVQTLAAIRETVDKTDRATERQIEAVMNIKNARRSAEQEDKRAGSRRYEGFNRPKE